MTRLAILRLGNHRQLGPRVDSVLADVSFRPTGERYDGLLVVSGLFDTKSALQKHVRAHVPCSNCFSSFRRSAWFLGPFWARKPLLVGTNCELSLFFYKISRVRVGIGLPWNHQEFLFFVKKNHQLLLFSARQNHQLYPIIGFNNINFCPKNPPSTKIHNALRVEERTAPTFNF